MSDPAQSGRSSASPTVQESSKIVIGAQNAFVNPSSVAGKILDFGSHKRNTSTSSNPSPRADRKAMKSREEYINNTEDAWGDFERPKSAAMTPTKPSGKSLTKTHQVPSTSQSPPSKLSISSTIQANSPAPQPLAKSCAQRDEKFEALLALPTVDLDALRKLAWNGIPVKYRPTCWKLLMYYLPCSRERRDAVLARKRKEYQDMAAQCLGKSGAQDKQLHHQIHIDILRTNPTPIFSNSNIQDALERVLYCWAMRHPASGYVQGINDLLTPFFSVFISPFLDDAAHIDQVPLEHIEIVEADAFWCLTKLIDGIQDNYTFAQPGIQKQVGKLRDLVGRIDSALAAHFAQEGIEFIQFSFRWMNCLLMREVSHATTIRMWDTYLSEEGDLNDFHLYVCAAFLIKWSKDLRVMPFADMMLFLQALPTKDWAEKDIEMILSEAFMLKSLFHNSPGHFTK